MDKKSELIRFFVLLALFYGLWYLLYHFIIEPDGRLNAFLAYNIVSINAGLLEFLGYDVFIYDRVVGLLHTAGIEVIDECTATEVLGLFVGFVLAYPGSNQIRAFLIPIGLLILYLVNIFRIFALILVQNYYPDYLDVSHDYTANTVFYIVIFLLWIIWATFGEESEKSNLTISDSHVS